MVAACLAIAETTRHWLLSSGGRLRCAKEGLWSQVMSQVVMLVGAIVITAGGAVSGPAAERPNVVIVVADDLGLQLGCYGDRQAKTPHLDALAAEATRFTRAHSTTASCSASRSVILSGLYNHATGHYGHAHGDGHFSSYDSVQSLPALLKQAGYRTALCGKYHLAPEYVYPFDVKLQDGTLGGRHGVRMAANSRTWIEQGGEQPFFLYFCPTDPHRHGTTDTFANHRSDPGHYAGITPVPFSPAEMKLPGWLTDRPEVRDEWAEFYQAIARLDAGVGALVTALKETGVWDNTLLMFLSDNGPPFPGAKTTAYQPGIQLPLLIRDPKQPRQGVVCDALVNWADLTPTVLDYCGVPVPSGPPVRPGENQGPRTNPRTPARNDARPAVSAGSPAPKAPADLKTAYRFHGRSLVPILGEASPPGWDESFASHTFHEVTMYYPMRVIQRGKFKLIWNIASGLPFPFASDLQASPTWQGVLARKDPQEPYGPRSVQRYVNRPAWELFDLESDPLEAKNLAEDAAYQSIVADLKHRLRVWQKQTNDPWVSKWDYE